MAYLLKPNLPRIENPAVPDVCANEEVFVYPQPSSMNYAGRPNTMLYGTAPYMAGKGAPNHLVMVDDELRPQSTSVFNKKYVETYKKNTFPLQDMSCSVPLRVHTYDPQSSRAQLQNEFFNQRYAQKK
jgi:hypothetical protein